MSDTTQQYMLLFTIGPVQSFIAQARKTRDLWLGSYLLSVLMEAAMEGMEKQLVFPAEPTISGKIPDLPNRYIAIFNDPEQAKLSVDASIDRIQKKWEAICKDVWQEIFVRARKQSNDTLQIDTALTIWKRQVMPDKFFEMFWVIVKGDPTNYHVWLSETQVALAARKRLRHVQMVTIEELDEQGEKSTISGDREALRGSGKYREDVRKFWSQLILNGKHTSRDINKNGEERLDAIDTVKRFAHLSQPLQEKHVDAYFPSTSSIATASFVERLFGVITSEQSPLITGPLKKWLEVTKRLLPDMPPTNIPYLFAHANGDPNEILKRDGDCYFPETFVPTRLEKDYNTSPHNSGSIATHGRQALRELLEQTDALNVTRPTPYYAMLQMDGDKMGVLLGEVGSKDEHQAISSALSKFSRGKKDTKPETISAKTLVEEKYPGRLIYAGGDDVFALAPLARDSASEGEPLTVLELADKLQQTYQSVVRHVMQGKDRQKKVTASTGIAIAHHFTSLSYVRRASKEAESQAKKTYGRNSLVVTVLRRSGQQTRVGCRWRYNIKLEDEQETILDPIALFSEFYKLFKADRLSPKCVYLLLEEVSALVHPALFRPYENVPNLSNEEQRKAREEWENAATSMPEMQKSEIRRILRRQRSSKDDVSDDDAKRLAENLVMLAMAMEKDTRKSDQDDKEEVQDDSEEKTRAVELHSEKRRYGLVEVLGWLQVMVFLTRKEQE